ncbi:hypothetical protein GGR21_002183 [Dysgonomonas hofstadii]|uniref:Por secretion system C-terminal sorting domain-containing protein n=1 Tax=Dysgonomonas hofstadii TaxID=637886 RepID=A0A840CME2_9BACT|nr:T9SS C-terminal target domain-containing protein [Dysgonomonas hofstadii]MBB4036281.1 hypothetical protein [Dysgonomonas hofstadii]
MVKYRTILFLLLATGASFAASIDAADADFPMSNSVFEQQSDNAMTLDITINGTTKLKMENIPTEGYLEVYSILGVKITSKNLKTCEGGQCYLDLSKGLYILKAGKVAVKVIVR